jgi:hypothetical protein
LLDEGAQMHKHATIDEARTTSLMSKANQERRMVKTWTSSVRIPILCVVADNQAPQGILSPLDRRLEEEWRARVRNLEFRAAEARLLAAQKHVKADRVIEKGKVRRRIASRLALTISILTGFASHDSSQHQDTAHVPPHGSHNPFQTKSGRAFI